MKLATIKFTKFVNMALRILLSFVAAGSIIELGYYLTRNNIGFSALILLLAAICTYIFYLCLEKGYSDKKILIALFIGALILRLVYVISINNSPVSDFKTMYDSAGDFINGANYMFKGKSYFAKYPHLTFTVIYFALMQKLFSNSLMAIKILNAIFSAIDVLLIYLIAKEVFKTKKKPLWAAFLTSIYPPLIIYPAVLCTENMAIPFYLLSIYIFILAINEKKNYRWLILSAILLSFGNLFRMVAPVMVIAYIMYILIYWDKSVIKKCRGISYILASFIIIFVLASSILKISGITQNQLWTGGEPVWTSILKGTNIENYGRWNKEDAEIVNKYSYDYRKLSEICIDTISNRLTTTPPLRLVLFYTTKYASEWSRGDFAAVFWAQLLMKKEDLAFDLDQNAMIYIQLFYCVLIILTCIGLYNKKEYLKNPIINLFYIIFCGYALLYLITECQERYSFIVCWLFIILPLTLKEGKNEKII